MDFLRFQPLMLMVATAFAARMPLCDQGKRFDPTKSIENCLCPLGSPTIISSLDPDNAGVERLVIFVYRKLNTGELITFIPHRQLQHQIPDFPEEHGSVYEINEHQSILQLFDNTPSTEIRGKARPDKSILPGQIYAPHPERKPGKNKANQFVIVVDVKGHKQLNLIHGRPQDHSYNNIKHPSWLIPVNNPLENHDALKQIIPHPNHGPGSYDNPIIEDHPIYVTPKYLNEETNWPEDAVSEKPLTENQYPSDFYDSPTHPYSYNFDEAHDPTEESYLEHPTSEENESNRDTTDTLELSNPDMLPLGPNNNPHVSDDLQPAENELNTILPSNKFLKVKMIRVPRKDKHGRVTGWQTIDTYWDEKSHRYLMRPEVNPISYDGAVSPFDDNKNKHNEKVPFWSGKGSHGLVSPQVINENPISYHSDISQLIGDNYGYHEKVPSFDYWLKNQLNITTINANKLPTDDIIALHTAIRNVLLQNGLIVTKHGTLIDGHGMVSSLDNLKLRPILLGKSISFDRFIRHVHSDINFTIPPNSPFIEGLLLTMINPPKILGIVPLLRSSASKEVYPKHDDEKVPINMLGSHKVGKRTSFKVLPISHLVSFRRDSPRAKARLTLKKPPVTKISKHKQSEQSFLTKQGMKEGRAQGRYVGKPTDEGLSEEVPDFRIIGGMSATVSGTPLLNKGRSGLEFEYENEYGPNPKQHYTWSRSSSYPSVVAGGGRIH